MKRIFLLLVLCQCASPHGAAKQPAAPVAPPRVEAAAACPPCAVCEEDGAAEKRAAACERGDLRACVAAADDEARDEHHEKALAYAERACAGGQAAACSVAAIQLYKLDQNFKTPSSLSRFEDLCRRGCRDGDGASCVDLISFNRLFAPHNPFKIADEEYAAFQARAKALLEAECNAGSARSCSNLAQFHRDWGDGNPPAVHVWLARGCNGGRFVDDCGALLVIERATPAEIAAATTMLRCFCTHGIQAACEHLAGPARRPKPENEPYRCSSDKECSAEAPFCVDAGTHGEPVAGHTGVVGWCVRRCDDGNCPKGLVCQGEHRPSPKTFQPVCLPPPRYGPGAIGDTCEHIQDCGRDAPYCVDMRDGNRCTRTCDAGCPAGYECQDRQWAGNQRFEVKSFCMPRVNK